MGVAQVIEVLGNPFLFFEAECLARDMQDGVGVVSGFLL
jgi:hypothetical protein